jgi:hypothetical protein
LTLLSSIESCQNTALMARRAPLAGREANGCRVNSHAADSLSIAVDPVEAALALNEGAASKELAMMRRLGRTELVAHAPSIRSLADLFNESLRNTLYQETIATAAESRPNPI